MSDTSQTTPTIEQNLRYLKEVMNPTDQELEEVRQAMLKEIASRPGDQSMTNEASLT